MRGVVSLAAALSIPLLTPQGEPFPFRNLILIITFVVILVTLVFQGLTLPWLIRQVRLDDRNALVPEARQELLIQQQLTAQALASLADVTPPDQAPNDDLSNPRARLHLDARKFGQALDGADHGPGMVLM